MLLLLTSENSMLEKILQEKHITQDSSPYEKLLAYNTYVKKKKANKCNKLPADYNNIKLSLTSRQIQVLKLVALGLSNCRIAKRLNCTESAVKLVIHRSVKYLERVICEDIDRFSLIIIAQQILFLDQLTD